MPRNYPISKDVWPPGSFYAGKSFDDAGGVDWPGDVGDQFEALQDWTGYALDATNSGTLTGRMRAVEGVAFNAATLAGFAADGATDNATPLQNALDFVGAFGGGVINLPPGDIRIGTGLVGSHSGVIVRGAGPGATRIIYDGGVGDAFSFIGSDLDFFDRLFYCGLQDLTLDNDGSAGAVGLRIFAGTHHHHRNLNFSAWRGGAIRASNHADSTYDYIEAEYCGSADDSDIAVIQFDADGSSAWAVDRIVFNHLRAEACGDRILDFHDGGGLYVNKILLNFLKIENMQTGGDGMGGSAGAGAMIYLANTGGIVFVSPDFTFGGRRNGTHAGIPAMVKMAGWAEAHFLGSSGVNLNPPGGAFQPFASLFDLSDSHAVLTIDGLGIGAFAATSLPTQVIKVTNRPTVGLLNGYFKGGTVGTPGNTGVLPPWISGEHKPTVTLARGVEEYHFGGDLPALVDRNFSHPGGVNLILPQIVSGRLRFTAPGSNTDDTIRRAYGFTRAGVHGDSEIRSRWHDSSTDLGTLSRFQPGHVHRMTSHKQIDARGTASGGTTTTVVDSGIGWTADEWHGPTAHYREQFVTIIEGPGFGETRRITDNSTDTLTVNAAFSTAITSASVYEIWHFVTRGVAVVNTIAFGEHQKFQLTAFDGTTFVTPDAADFVSYLKPSTLRELPWHVKTRLRDNAIDLAVWVDGDNEPEYGAGGGQTDTLLLPPSFDDPGLSGLYVGHLAANDWLEFDDVVIRGV